MHRNLRALFASRICSTHFTFWLYQRRPLLEVTWRLPETQKIERLLEQLDFVFTFNSFLFTSASSVSPFSEIIPCPVQSFREASAQNRKQRQVRHLTAGESIKHTCGKDRLNIDRENTIEDRNSYSYLKWTILLLIWKNAKRWMMINMMFIGPCIIVLTEE